MIRYFTHGITCKLIYSCLRMITGIYSMKNWIYSWYTRLHHLRMQLNLRTVRMIYTKFHLRMIPMIYAEFTQKEIIHRQVITYAWYSGFTHYLRMIPGLRKSYFYLLMIRMIRMIRTEQYADGAVLTCSPAPPPPQRQRAQARQGWPRCGEARTRDSRLAESPKSAPRASRLARLSSLTLITGSREADSAGCPQVLQHDFESTASCCLHLGLSLATLSWPH